MLLLRGDFTSRSMLIDRSHSQLVMTIICQSVLILGKKSPSANASAFSGVLSSAASSDRPLHFCFHKSSSALRVPGEGTSSLYTCRMFTRLLSLSSAALHLDGSKWIKSIIFLDKATSNLLLSSVIKWSISGIVRLRWKWSQQSGAGTLLRCC